MTLSPGCRPSSTSHLSASARLTFTGRTSTLLSLPTTIAVVSPFGSRAMPCCGTRIAFSRTPLPTSARTYIPGSSTFCGFGTTTRSATLPVPDRLVMVSPMIGIGRLAAFSRLMPLLGWIPYFEKSRWLDVQPEFNPFKYNSFPVNGVRQSWLLVGAVQTQLLQLRATGRSDRLPPILAFQSVLDGTVSTEAVVRNLFDQLPANGSELVLFDINRQGVLAPMLRSSAGAMLDDLQPIRGLADSKTLSPRPKSSPTLPRATTS